MGPLERTNDNAGSDLTPKKHPALTFFDLIPGDTIPLRRDMKKIFANLEKASETEKKEEVAKIITQTKKELVTVEASTKESFINGIGLPLNAEQKKAAGLIFDVYTQCKQVIDPSGKISPHTFIALSFWESKLGELYGTTGGNGLMQITGPCIEETEKILTKGGALNKQVASLCQKKGVLDELKHMLDNPYLRNSGGRKNDYTNFLVGATYFGNVCYGKDLATDTINQLAGKPGLRDAINERLHGKNISPLNKTEFQEFLTNLRTNLGDEFAAFRRYNGNNSTAYNTIGLKEKDLYSCTICAIIYKMKKG